MNFMQAMNIVEEGFHIWREKEHNAKWWKRIDGTPIPNDLAVNIAEAMCRSSADRIEALEAALRKISNYDGNGRLGEIARAALAPERRCAKCGCTTKGEEALVGGEIWCHPCADRAALAPEQEK